MSSYRFFFPSTIFIKDVLPLDHYANQHLKNKIPTSDWVKIARDTIFVYRSWPHSHPYSYYMSAFSSINRSIEVLSSKLPSTYNQSEAKKIIDEINEMEKHKRNLDYQLSIEELKSMYNQFIGGPSIYEHIDYSKGKYMEDTPNSNVKGKSIGMILGVIQDQNTGCTYSFVKYNGDVDGASATRAVALGISRGCSLQFTRLRGQHGSINTFREHTYCIQGRQPGTELVQMLNLDSSSEQLNCFSKIYTHPRDVDYSSELVNHCTGYTRQSFSNPIEITLSLGSEIFTNSMWFPSWYPRNKESIYTIKSNYTQFNERGQYVNSVSTIGEIFGENKIYESKLSDSSRIETENFNLLFNHFVNNINIPHSKFFYFSKLANNLMSTSTSSVPQTNSAQKQDVASESDKDTGVVDTSNETSTLLNSKTEENTFNTQKEDPVVSSESTNSVDSDAVMASEDSTDSSHLALINAINSDPELLKQFNKNKKAFDILQNCINSSIDNEVKISSLQQKANMLEEYEMKNKVNAMKTVFNAAESLAKARNIGYDVERFNSDRKELNDNLNNYGWSNFINSNTFHEFIAFSNAMKSSPAISKKNSSEEPETKSVENSAASVDEKKEQSVKQIPPERTQNVNSNENQIENMRRSIVESKRTDISARTILNSLSQKALSLKGLNVSYNSHSYKIPMSEAKKPALINHSSDTPIPASREIQVNSSAVDADTTPAKIQIKQSSVKRFSSAPSNLKKRSIGDIE
jgi:hypothetical protein